MNNKIAYIRMLRIVFNVFANKELSLRDAKIIVDGYIYISGELPGLDTSGVEQVFRYAIEVLRIMENITNS